MSDEERRDIRRRVAAGEPGAALELARAEEADDGEAAMLNERLQALVGDEVRNGWRDHGASPWTTTVALYPVEETLLPLLRGDRRNVSAFHETPLRYDDGLAAVGGPQNARAWWQEARYRWIVVSVLDDDAVVIGFGRYPEFGYDETGRPAYARPWPPQAYWETLLGDPTRPARPPWNEVWKNWAREARSDRIRVPRALAERWLALFEADDL